MKRVEILMRRRRHPRELPTQTAAIRNHCLECCGYQDGEVERCSAPACWLYPWRTGEPARDVR